MTGGPVPRRGSFSIGRKNSPTHGRVSDDRQQDRASSRMLDTYSRAENLVLDLAFPYLAIESSIS